MCDRIGKDDEILYLSTASSCEEGYVPTDGDSTVDIDPEKEVDVPDKNLRNCLGGEEGEPLCLVFIPSVNENSELRMS